MQAAATVAALSIDDEATIQALIARHGSTFPVGHNPDARVKADLTGAFVNPDPINLPPKGLLHNPTGRVLLSA